MCDPYNTSVSRPDLIASSAVPWDHQVESTVVRQHTSEVFIAKPDEHRVIFKYRIDWSVDDMISTVDINGVAGNQPGCVMSQKCRRGADVLDAHLTVSRRLGLHLFK